jgi:hypothetical protein
MRFNISDPCMGLALPQIPDLIDRLGSWLSRALADPAFDESQSVQIIGAVHVLQGMDYHYRAYLRHEALGSAYLLRIEDFMGKRHGLGPIPTEDFPRASAEERAHLEALNHEAIAYLNRLGQFYYFAQAVRGLNALPKVRALIPFRNKHSAHRSIDASRGEEPEVQRSQAMAFSFHRLFKMGVVRFQMPHDGEHIEFCMSEDHPVVLQQCADLMFSLHRVEA